MVSSRAIINLTVFIYKIKTKNLLVETVKSKIEKVKTRIFKVCLQNLLSSSSSSSSSSELIIPILKTFSDSRI